MCRTARFTVHCSQRKDKLERRRFCVTARVNLHIIITGVHEVQKAHFVPAMANPLKSEVIRLYKNLLYLGRDYPQGSAYFRERLKSAFMKNRDVTDPEKIKKLVARGDFVIKELEALYFLRKYRAMKKRYYDPDK
ncbi:LYR motif-containing protein 5A-like isoform X2 [Anabas testudineus]|uniref:Complex 1 LYR protein domain-containing protein n=1 Tax=Anabas testudineus TaxID=64144 RepID=A0AAQ6IR19_ANATE|nr:LYR motif-containing protein 5A-like isoform X2 [Anabas testudineus]